MIRCIDSHAHLDHTDFAGALEGVLTRAREAGVEQIVNVASNRDSSLACLRLAEAHDWIFATAGIHPHDAADAAPDDPAEIERLCAHARVVAVGETGLDYHYDFSPRPQQRESFARCVDIARRVNKPLVIHIREAHADAMTILRQAGGAVRGVVHCFTGDPAQAREIVELGLLVSFSGIVTFPKAREIQAAAAAVPADRLLIETDSPYLAPVPHRGRRNEPAYVVHTAEAVACLRQLSVEELASLAAVNTRALFGLPDPSPR
jgi:TatD DNase family protein